MNQKTNSHSIILMIVFLCLFCLPKVEARPSFHGAKLVHEFDHNNGKFIEMFEFPLDCDRMMLRGRSMLASMVDLMIHSFWCWNHAWCLLCKGDVFRLSVWCLYVLYCLKMSVRLCALFVNFHVFCTIVFIYISFDAIDIL